MDHGACAASGPIEWAFMETSWPALQNSSSTAHCAPAGVITDNCACLATSGCLPPLIDHFALAGRLMPSTLPPTHDMVPLICHDGMATSLSCNPVGTCIHVLPVQCSTAVCISDLPCRWNPSSNPAVHLLLQYPRLQAP